MKRTDLLWVAVIGVVAVGCSKTERTKSNGPERPGASVGTSGAVATPKDDREFVHDVVIMNMAEIELSRMALNKAASPNIKVFAQMLIDDHSAAGDKLKNAVSGSSSDWPDQLDEKHRKIADDLARKQGIEFDREYVETMVHGHQDVAAKLASRLDVQSLADWNAAAAGRTQSKALPDPKAELRDVPLRPEKSSDPLTMKINQWAAETYPVVQKHLDTARTLENATKKRTS
jgi:putative membrane protein